MLKKMTTLALMAMTILSCGQNNNGPQSTSSSALASNQDFVPTALTSSEAEILFNSLNPRVTWGTTQCFKRAHVWTHDLSKLRNINPKLAEEHPAFEGQYNTLRSSLHSKGVTGINTMKVFIMFTNRLQMECDNTKDCKWFFHVAPYVMADGAETVIDRGLFKSPLPLNTWAKNLITMGYEKHTGRNVDQCRVIDSYVQYDDANTLYRSTLSTVNDLLKEFLQDEIKSKGRVGKGGTDINTGWALVKKKIQRHEYSNDYLRSVKVPASIIAQYDSILSMDLCQLRKVPMYYYDPRSVEFADKNLAAPRTSWLEEDLEYSYDEFKEGLDEY